MSLTRIAIVSGVGLVVSTYGIYKVVENRRKIYDFFDRSSFSVSVGSFTKVIKEVKQQPTPRRVDPRLQEIRNKIKEKEDEITRFESDTPKYHYPSMHINTYYDIEGTRLYIELNELIEQEREMREGSF